MDSPRTRKRKLEGGQGLSPLRTQAHEPPTPTAQAGHLFPQDSPLSTLSLSPTFSPTSLAAYPLQPSPLGGASPLVGGPTLTPLSPQLGSTQGAPPGIAPIQVKVARPPAITIKQPPSSQSSPAGSGGSAPASAAAQQLFAAAAAAQPSSPVLGTGLGGGQAGAEGALAGAGMGQQPMIIQLPAGTALVMGDTLIQAVSVPAPTAATTLQPALPAGPAPMLLGPVPVLAPPLVTPASPTLAAAGGAMEAVSPTHALSPALAGLQLMCPAPLAETAFGTAAAALPPMVPLPAAEAALAALQGLPALPAQQGSSEGEVSSPAEQEPAPTGGAADGGPSYDQLLSESPFPTSTELAAALSLTPSQLALTPQKTWSLSQLMAMPSLDLPLPQLNLPSSSSSLGPLDAGMPLLPPDAGPDPAAPDAAAAGPAAVEAAAGRQQQGEGDEVHEERLFHGSLATPLRAQAGIAVAPSAGFAEVDDMLRAMPSVEQGGMPGPQAPDYEGRDTPGSWELGIARRLDQQEVEQAMAEAGQE